MIDSLHLLFKKIFCLKPLFSFCFLHHISTALFPFSPCGNACFISIHYPLGGLQLWGCCLVLVVLLLLFCIWIHVSVKIVTLHLIQRDWHLFILRRQVRGLASLLLQSSFQELSISDKGDSSDPWQCKTDRVLQKLLET